MDKEWTKDTETQKLLKYVSPLEKDPMAELGFESRIIRSAGSDVTIEASVRMEIETCKNNNDDYYYYYFIILLLLLLLLLSFYSSTITLNMRLKFTVPLNNFRSLNIYSVQHTKTGLI